MKARQWIHLSIRECRRLYASRRRLGGNPRQGQFGLTRKMDEKLKFVSWFLDGEKIAALCREFGISRATGQWKTLSDRKC